MDLIPSFAVDHTKLVPGIYISRTDHLTGGDVCITYDIRMKYPNREPAINPAAMHTIEHLVATYLRNDPYMKDKLIYWGPMGCMTGCYMILNQEVPNIDLFTNIYNAMSFVVNYQGTIPGTDVTQCGNYLMHDLPMAKWEAKQFLERMDSDKFSFVYPKIERQDTKEGHKFYDS